MRSFKYPLNGAGHPSHTKAQPFVGQRQFLHFSVVLRPWVRFWVSTPRPFTLQSSGLTTGLILPRSQETELLTFLLALLQGWVWVFPDRTGEELWCSWMAWRSKESVAEIRSGEQIHGVSVQWYTGNHWEITVNRVLLDTIWCFFLPSRVARKSLAGL